MIYKLELVSPEFDSELTSIIMELNHLKKVRLRGTTAPWIFFQLKEILHLFESVGSTRIEGNNTTISEYIERKIEKTTGSDDGVLEIENVEKAMDFIEEAVEEESQITSQLIREIQQLVVSNLQREGDKIPGSFRTWNVSISSSRHVPPEHYQIRELMDELLGFINDTEKPQFDLIRAALAHHRFAWIHPFGNGNGRVGRLFTYALLIKYGFGVKQGRLINPTAVFCTDRDKYYEMLAFADKGTKEGKLKWCEYVLKGLLSEIAKLDKLLDKNTLSREVLLPSLKLGVKKKYITEEEYKVLSFGVETENQTFKAGDLNEVLSSTPRQRTNILSKLKDKKMIASQTEGGKSYYVRFGGNYLMRCLVQVMQEKGFIPNID